MLMTYSLKSKGRSCQTHASQPQSRSCQITNLHKVCSRHLHSYLSALSLIDLLI
jgi:hypothetical protein